MNLIIGNAIMLLASVIMVCLGLVKNKKKIILLQTIQIFMMAIGSIFLCTIPGTIINLFACARNILAYYDKLNKNNKIILIILSVSFSLIFNNIGIWGIFPVISSVLFISFIDTKNIVKYKLLEVTSTGLWLAHDIYILAYTCVIFDIFTIITNGVTYIKLKGFNFPQIRKLRVLKKAY